MYKWKNSCTRLCPDTSFKRPSETNLGVRSEWGRKPRSILETRKIGKHQFKLRPMPDAEACSANVYVPLG